MQPTKWPVSQHVTTKVLILLEPSWGWGKNGSDLSSSSQAKLRNIHASSLSQFRIENIHLHVNISKTLGALTWQHQTLECWEKLPSHVFQSGTSPTGDLFDFWRCQAVQKNNDFSDSKNTFESVRMQGTNQENHWQNSLVFCESLVSHLWVTCKATTFWVSKPGWRLPALKC